MRRVISVLGIVASMLAGQSAAAQDLPCDFLTGGGFIITTEDAKANFGVGGSCKRGGNGHGLWGHLQYIDHGTGLNVHWLTITGYFFCTDPACTSPVPETEFAVPGTRMICGTARTNQPSPNDTVNWVVTATDNGKGQNTDIFSIQVPALGYSQAGPLAGGNIMLHKPNPSTKGPVSDLATGCPAFGGPIID